MVKAKKIFCVVAYDIQDDRSRIQISKILEKYGTRINYSVFECMFTDRQFQKIQINLERWIFPPCRPPFRLYPHRSHQILWYRHRFCCL